MKKKASGFQLEEAKRFEDASIKNTDSFTTSMEYLESNAYLPDAPFVQFTNLFWNMTRRSFSHTAFALNLAVQ